MKPVEKVQELMEFDIVHNGSIYESIIFNECRYSSSDIMKDTYDKVFYIRVRKVRIHRILGIVPVRRYDWNERFILGTWNLHNPDNIKFDIYDNKRWFDADYIRHLSIDQIERHDVDMLIIGAHMPLVHKKSI